MRLEDKIRLRHMLDASRKAVEFCAGKTEVDLAKDEMLTLAVIRLIEIVGEAAKNISVDVRNSHPGIPWKEISGTRDRLIHGYFDVDLEILGKIVMEDLPALNLQLETILARE
ncbi:MAG: DUF86 domain-containing protein [Candidatus Omnitrophica bacterium]|nr:DUF86 domain-containing protein [Candidatus Omnitrophota bacterium]